MSKKENISQKRSRDTWGDEETDHFLALIREQNVLAKLDTKKFKVDQVYADVEKSMAEKGFNKSVPQLKTKLGNLKSKFTKNMNVYLKVRSTE